MSKATIPDNPEFDVDGDGNTYAEIVPDNLPAVQNHGAVSPLYDASHDDWADVDSGDMTGDVGGTRIPFISLNRKFGYGFDLDGTGQNYVDTLDFVWLARGRSRVWFRDPFGQGDGKPKCRSFDGRVADLNAPVFLPDYDPGNYEGELPHSSGNCMECPLGQWQGNTPPPCMESMEALVFLPDPGGVGRLARLRFSGMALSPAKAYWDSFFTRLPKRPPIAYVSRIHLEPVDTDNGKFLVPRFERVAELARADAQPLIEERAERTKDWAADIADDVVAGVTETVEQSSEDAEAPF